MLLLFGPCLALLLAARAAGAVVAPFLKPTNGTRLAEGTPDPKEGGGDWKGGGSLRASSAVREDPLDEYPLDESLQPATDEASYI